MLTFFFACAIGGPPPNGRVDTAVLPEGMAFSQAAGATLVYAEPDKIPGFDSIGAVDFSLDLEPGTSVFWHRVPVMPWETADPDRAPCRTNIAGRGSVDYDYNCAPQIPLTAVSVQGGYTDAAIVWNSEGTGFAVHALGADGTPPLSEGTEFVVGLPEHISGANKTYTFTGEGLHVVELPQGRSIALPVEFRYND